MVVRIMSRTGLAGTTPSGKASRSSIWYAGEDECPRIVGAEGAHPRAIEGVEQAVQLVLARAPFDPLDEACANAGIEKVADKLK